VTQRVPANTDAVMVEAPHPAAGKAEPGRSVVDVWYASLDVSPARLRDLSRCLNPEENARAARFHFDRDRARFIAARGTLRTILARYLETSPDLVRFRYGAQGKPEVHDLDLHFNVSHADDLLVIGVSPDQALGIDIEGIPSAHVVDSVSPLVFSDPECGTLELLPTAERSECFAVFWSRKEAYIKAEGGGMSIDLSSLDVATVPGRVLQRKAGSDHWLCCPDWNLRSLPVKHGFAGTVAAPGDWRLTWHDLPPDW
jgi:4'-phosphopantetheinyl transferase